MIELHGRNGTVGRRGEKAAPKGATARRGKRVVRYARRWAMLPGGVGLGLLGVSLSHCTEAVQLLTGSGWVLSGLMAVGIDAGFVAAELSELVSHGTTAAVRVRRWALAYTWAAVVLSVLLNAYSFGLHAAPGMTWAAWGLGVCVPAFVYLMGRIAAGLWLSAEE